jgi:RimJ/RimL family protein N-acetyltransferase
MYAVMLNIGFGGEFVETINTARLYMRERTEDDWKYLERLYAADKMLAALYKGNPEEVEKSYRNVIKKSSSEVWLIFLKDTNEFCGEIELQHTYENDNELGVDLLSDYQNIGIGTESIIAFTNWLHLNKRLTKIAIRIDPDNKRSQHVFKKLGAVFIGQKSGFSKELQKVFQNSNEFKDIDFDSIGPYFYELSLPVNFENNH